ncbi:hypothetical protein PSACC_00158 [Paramicrosporidium saccamoebae]|uniref:Uncharacterized protein n=1 Tax=Paramicrosporidium saccamoebae TaxID=1246581 RepID=A0A2H9TQQ6_9FUNG|nr:hypothetical protein PSACC_00158 [Paramicrosporidium saccamoebae]
MNRLLLPLLFGLAICARSRSSEPYFPIVTRTLEAASAMRGTELVLSTSAESAIQETALSDNASDNSTVESEFEELTEDEPLPEPQLIHGDAVVQNNYNVKLGETTVTPPEMFIYAVGVLLMLGLVFGVVILGTIMMRLLSDNERSRIPIIPSPGYQANWKHDPVYDMPNGYGPQFEEQTLHPTNYREHAE